MASPVQQKSILIVDDEALIRQNLVDIFDDEGWQVFEADGADAAIRVLEENASIRVVLTDIQMPGSMNGVRLAHFVRNRYPPTVLFVVSGGLAPDYSELPTRTLFLAKPFDPQFVLDEIARLDP